jgi:hypothetical protein
LGDEDRVNSRLPEADHFQPLVACRKENITDVTSGI